MFVGHDGLGLAAKRVEPRLPLGWLFVAAQLADIAWAVLLLLGVERATVVPGARGPGGVEQVFVPYSHGLAATAVWAAAAYAAVRLLPPGRALRRGAALALAGIVASHCPLDVVVHPPELPVVDHSREIGLGLGESLVAGYLAEAAVLLAGLWLYLRATEARNALGRYGMVGLVAVLLAFHLVVTLSSPPGSLTVVALSNLAAYGILALAGAWLDRQRRPAAPRPPRPVTVSGG